MGKYDYRQKTVSMGIDVHKNHFSCVSVCEDQVEKKDTMPGNANALLAYIQNHFMRQKSDKK